MADVSLENVSRWQVEWFTGSSLAGKPQLAFGTDGVRGIANEGLLPEDAMKLGLASARLFGGPMVIGRDTRVSGGMLSAAFAAGAASGGAEVLDLGVLSTPGVARLGPEIGASAAVVVSASHNAYPDNGIKFFSGEGRKLPSKTERDLEHLVSEPYDERPTGTGVGAVETMDGAVERYARSVLEGVSPRAEGVKVLLDCANGAAFEAAPRVFGEIGAALTVVANEPDGTNINQGCGSTHIDGLDVSGHDVAFAFDGDADRVLAVDERGNVVNGDKILAILARDLSERDALPGGVVVTVMSNIGFFKAMESLGIPYQVTAVGDRYVAEAMHETGAALGGEQSGHVILSGSTTTGDGVVTALALLDVMVRSGRPLSDLAQVMQTYPQRLINVRVGSTSEAKAIAVSEEVERAVEAAGERLGEEGRILLRPSGTEPLVRVMVEHADGEMCVKVCEEVAEVVTGAEVKV